MRKVKDLQVMHATGYTDWMYGEWSLWIATERGTGKYQIVAVDGNDNMFYQTDDALDTIHEAVQFVVGLVDRDCKWTLLPGCKQIDLIRLAGKKD